MLRLKNIKKDYKVAGGAVPALKGISIDFRENEFVSVLGPSGCGKTTLLNIVGGLDGYSGGDLVINGISTKKYKDSDWDAYRNHRVGFIFQSFNLIGSMTALENVELPLVLRGVGRKNRRQTALEALERVGLSQRAMHRPSELSGGQQQRVAIARVLAQNPPLILADEPTGNLDGASSREILSILRQLNGEGQTVVMITHDDSIAAAAPVQMRMEAGRLK